MHHFIDNKGARAGIVKGSSGKPDSARIIDALHVELVALACQPWFGFVYSEDNLSDDPWRWPCVAPLSGPSVGVVDRKKGENIGGVI